jgi:nicotinamidase-related amidase
MTESAALGAGVEEHLAALRAQLRERGLGGRVGFGERPALLVVDLVRAFTDPSSPLGSDLDAEVAATAELMRAARAAAAPVIVATPHAEEGVWSAKIPANAILVPGSEWVEPDPRLSIEPGDQLLPKTYASCFFGTDLTTRLLSRGVDTLLIAGCSTSGCVRASAVDACSLGLRTIVVADAVGDRAPLSHQVALFDLDLKYADVVSSDQAIAQLAGGERGPVA